MASNIKRCNYLYKSIQIVKAYTIYVKSEYMERDIAIYKKCNIYVNI